MRKLIIAAVAAFGIAAGIAAAVPTMHYNGPSAMHYNSKPTLTRFVYGDGQPRSIVGD